ncbi:late control protein D [Budviciaceae bacterium BWR-B9]|uniref:Late control protein D n=1 Tax=Limnobaculum allomyrinae TaxID=2791986 RepID=A0ABS1IWH4_9GAMM|nr:MULTISPECIES: hypothetical protein [Limnobaculum]MBK5145932.1 late control protein D [Limnobaculum allomyrinae]MBV7694013.1 hypothetical protein [Limnobaculum sp. M2-1]
MEVIKPLIPVSDYRLLYEKNDISNELADYLLSISYTDYLSGQSDELAIELENIDGRRYGEWYPGQGDELTFELGWLGEERRQIGVFEIVDINFQFSPGTVTITAQAVGIKNSVRTKAAHAYENMTLDKVAKQIADRQGLTLVGAIEPIALDRLTQQESDIEFLKKLADEYDYAFKIDGNKLVFHAISELSLLDSVVTFKLTDISGGQIRDQIKQVPKAVEVKSHDPATKKTVIYDVKNEGMTAKDSSVSKSTTSPDTIKTSSRSSSPEVATAKAQAELAKANRERTTGNIDLMGNPSYLSGNTITLEAGGELNGDYLIQASQHTLDRSGGWNTRLDICRIREADIVSVKAEKSGQSKTGGAKSGSKKKVVIYDVQNGRMGQK